MAHAGSWEGGGSHNFLGHLVFPVLVDTEFMVQSNDFYVQGELRSILLGSYLNLQRLLVY